MINNNLLLYHQVKDSLLLDQYTGIYIHAGFYLVFTVLFLLFIDFTLPIRDVRASVGAGFLYPLVGTVCIH